MKTHDKVIIVTDLDGTLLDHNTYSFDGALPSLKQLEEHNIPVVINSSKTKAEIFEIRKQLENQHPFITENGSVIFTPQYYFSSDQPSNNNTLDTILLGTEREKVLDFLKALPKELREKFVSFYEASPKDIVDLTGLSESEAENALKRGFTEPLKWLGCEDSKEAFNKLAYEAGFNILQGGRFLHVMGKTDKGKATDILKKHYQDFYQEPVTVIVLGDSHNDIAMLTAADIAVVIRSQTHEPPAFTHPQKLISTHIGPEGWDDCIQQIIFKNTN